MATCVLRLEDFILPSGFSFFGLIVQAFASILLSLLGGLKLCTMDRLQTRSVSLQQRMNALSLSTKDECISQLENKVLLGKMVSTRIFSRKDLAHIITMSGIPKAGSRWNG